MSKNKIKDLKSTLRKEIIREIAGIIKSGKVVQLTEPVICIDNWDKENKIPIYTITTIQREANNRVQLISTEYDKPFDLVENSTENLIRLHYALIKCQKRRKVS